jgi:dTDP-4-dehydrorhamnose reductase
VMSATTEMMARKAPRPAYSVLGSERPQAEPLPHWRDSLRRYLTDRELEGAA